jgi:hypothetical protein
LHRTGPKEILAIPKKKQSFSSSPPRLGFALEITPNPTAFGLCRYRGSLLFFVRVDEHRALPIKDHRWTLPWTNGWPMGKRWFVGIALASELNPSSAHLLG